MLVTELDPVCDETMRGSCGCRSPAERFVHEANSVVSRSGDVFVSCFGGGICRRSPLPHLSFCVRGDWQHAVYTSYFSAAPSGSAAFNYTGNLLQRHPKLQFRFTPAHDMLTGSGDVRIFATYSYVGLRYSDIGNARPLPQHYTLYVDVRCCQWFRDGSSDLRARSAVAVAIQVLIWPPRVNWAEGIYHEAALPPAEESICPF